MPVRGHHIEWLPGAWPGLTRDHQRELDAFTRHPRKLSPQAGMLRASRGVVADRLVYRLRDDRDSVHLCHPLPMRENQPARIHTTESTPPNA